MDAATGNERRSTDDMLERAAGVMRMSADDDDQKHELHERLKQRSKIMLQAI